MKTFKLNNLSRMMLIPLALLPTTSTLHASDLEIYKGGTPGQTTIMMMLDTSGSMSQPIAGSSACMFPNGVTITSGTNTRTFSFSGAATTDPKGLECRGTDGEWYGDRITELKRAVLKLMDGSSLDGLNIGIGNFSSGGDGNTGRISVAAKPLDATRKALIRKEILGLKATGGTPTATAYAETAAYLLGKKTSSSAYAGFNKSSNSSDVRSTSAYVSPLPTENKTCSKQGIYFLTDGEPDPVNANAEDARLLMGDALSNSGITCSVSSSEFSIGKNGADGGWQCIATLAQSLNAITDQSIKTAVVGFGTVFPDSGRTIAADGSIGYDCAKIPSKNSSGQTINVDARNACKWGDKKNSFGKGGFYQGSKAEDVVKSFEQFVNDNKTDFTPTNLGTISIPRDPLDATKASNTGFFPMVQPVTDTTRRTWLGNLKKYYVLNGTLSDAATTGGDDLYETVAGKQTINPDARDIWTNGTAADYSKIDVGGAWNKIPVPSLLNVTGEPSTSTSERRVFIIDDGILKRVNKNSLATDYDITNTDPLPLKITTTTTAQRYALLNYLGYKNTYPPAATATLLTAQIPSLTATPSNPYRYLGGVVHSTPIVLSKKAVVQSTSSKGKITESTARDKEEYVVYGSMEGGLHIVDAATGAEKSVFVPREALDTQPETLASPDATDLTKGLAYGVDAPWAADNTFTTKSTKNTAGVVSTTYTAQTMNIYGGLRMGGRAIYGLDILSPASPKLLFRKTSSDSGFDRMGQIWSKPVVTYIRVNKVRTKVLIFGGGYDPLYETTYKNTQPTTATLGNAIYIIDATNGNLIWSGSASANADMKYSIVGQPAVRDYNADGLTDAIWAADLGGQVFRIDINNVAQTTNTFSVVRVATLAKLNPNLRFYERPSTAVFDEGQKRFILVSVGSGNRSFPLEKDAAINKVYGLIDTDATRDDLETMAASALKPVITENDLVSTGLLGKASTKANTTGDDSTTDTTALKNYVTDSTSGTIKKGWMFGLKSVGNDGYAKAFEESQLISGDLYYGIYDPQATLDGTPPKTCSGGVQGVSTVYRICAPYGNCAAYSTNDNSGIIGVPIGPSGDPRTKRIITPGGGNTEKCVGECGPSRMLVNNSPTTGQGIQYTQGRSIRPLRWYEW